MSALIGSIAVFDVCKELFYGPIWPVINHWTKYLSYYGWWFAIPGILFVLVFRKVHRYFLAIVKDEEAFAAAPPLVTHETPYWERAWIEWNVSFGLFLVAFLVGFGSWFFRQILIIVPVGMFCTMLVVFIGTFLVAMTSARFPFFRWLINIVGSLLIAIGALFVFAMFQLHWQYWKLISTVEHWPAIYSILILDLLVFWSAFVILLYAGLSLKRKYGRSVSPKPTAILGENRLPATSVPLRETKLGCRMTGIYCIGVVLILLGAFFRHNTTKVTWCYQSGLITQNRLANLSDDEVRRSVDFFCEAIRLSPELSIDRAVTINLLSNTLFQSYMHNPEAVLAGYDRVITLLMERDEFKFPRNYPIRNLINERGVIQFLNGEYREAIEDFSRVADVAPFPEFLYYRGFAYEKLDETELALADYSAAIAGMEKHEQQHIMTMLTHQIPESDIQQTQWFGVTLDELKAIREKLESQK